MEGNLKQVKSACQEVCSLAYIKKNPTDSIFFRARVEGCEDCATFHGDYNNISYGNDGVANLTWTDMSVFIPAAGGCAQSIFYARK